jgi:hypothetical protein
MSTKHSSRREDLVEEIANQPEDEYWETLDYSVRNEYDIVQILYSKKINAKTIRQIIKTSQLNHGLTSACQHNLAHIEDILDCINRITQTVNFNNSYMYDDIINDIFSLKQEELNAYLQTTYELDATHMTDTQIQEMLNIQHPLTNPNFYTP